MNINNVQNKLRVFLMLVVALTACKAEEFYFEEPAKNIAGSWRIIKVTRNGNDMTERAGDGFQITFRSGSTGALTYELNNNTLPFIVNKSGTWAFDDPAYPFHISFHPENGEEQTAPFEFPVAGGKRQISLRFSPGCKNNVYEYLLEENNANQ